MGSEVIPHTTFIYLHKDWPYKWVCDRTCGYSEEPRPNFQANLNEMLPMAVAQTQSKVNDLEIFQCNKKAFAKNPQTLRQKKS